MNFKIKFMTIMKRQQITIGSILEINIANEYFIYAQILKNASYAFFDFKSKNKIEKIEVLFYVPVLFITAIYNDVVNKGMWLKVGKLKIRPEFNELPLKFIEDPIKPNTFRLYDPNTGEMTPTTLDKIIGLERAAVWEGNAIEERIRDYYNGVPCVWLKDDYELFDQTKNEKK
jgi:Immunity protein 26